MIYTNTLNINSPFSLIKNGNQTSSARRSMKLVFRNGISRTILTGEEIKGENNASIEVALIDSMGNVVNVEPESSKIVEIVLVKGEFDAPEGEDWTVEEFDENIVPEMEGKKSLLAGNVRVTLLQGVGILDSIKLRHHTCKKESRMFRLGARVVDTFDRARVKEAMTEFFTVKDFRNKYFRKHETPSLSDKIVNLGAKKWESTLNNARACPDHKRMYCYIESLQKTGVVFNVIAQELLESAYKHWKDTVYFDDEDSLQQHFSSLSMFVDSQDFLEPYYPLLGDDICYGESSNGHSNSSFQSTNSTLDDDFSDSLNIDEMEILCDSPSQLSPSRVDWQTFLLEFDKFFVSKMWKTCFNVSRWLFSIKKLACFRCNHKPKKQKV
ncbi:hypothetical protein BUALT_Bualt07G0042200 [Buddleja alternifolia]|uniref:Calmodulin binding protein-like N-terminal domain-containing protein n=1 Tax=Buddleja alternifolia TaxID=168488 RepID=A0AAV6XFT7_9LAMI|nr:hypothetical protein BUALT_Bualt07G0042200 [Buddleja alternifolia]